MVEGNLLCDLPVFFIYKCVTIYEFGKGGGMTNFMLLIEMRKGVVTICYCDSVEVFKIVKSECLLQVFPFLV